MEIRVSSLLQGAKESSGISVVIDVLRCFTTETIAFQRGAEKNHIGRRDRKGDGFEEKRARYSAYGGSGRQEAGRF